MGRRQRWADALLCFCFGSIIIFSSLSKEQRFKNSWLNSGRAPWPITVNLVMRTLNPVQEAFRWTTCSFRMAGMLLPPRQTAAWLRSSTSKDYSASDVSAIPALTRPGKGKRGCYIVRNNAVIRSNSLWRSYFMFIMVFLAFSEYRHGESELEKPLYISAPVSKAKCASQFYLLFHFSLFCLFVYVEIMKAKVKEVLTFHCSVIRGKKPKLKFVLLPGFYPLSFPILFSFLFKLSLPLTSFSPWSL